MGIVTSCGNELEFFEIWIFTNSDIIPVALDYNERLSIIIGQIQRKSLK